MSKIQKTISSATAAAFLVVAIAQPAFAAGNMIDQTQQQVETAQQQQDPQYQKMQQQQQQQIQQVQQQQQNFKQYISPSGNVDLSRQTIYDSASGQLITLIQNSLGQVFAYTQSGQQVAVQTDWLKNLSFPQNINYSPTVGINGNVAGGGTVDTTPANISQTKAAQLSAVLSAIKTDGNLNAVGKIAKALLALEAIKENNQIIRQQYLAQQKAKVQAAQEQKTQQAAQQQKAVAQQKRTPANANAKKGEQQPEYASVLRDTEANTGGTTTEITLNLPTNVDTQQSTELPLQLDLIGKVAAVAGDTVTLQDTKGQQIDVDAAGHNLQEGNYVNMQGTALSGADGNIYIVKDPESGMNVSLNTIDENTYNQKAAEQQKAESDFAAEHPEISTQESTEETTYVAPSENNESGWFDGVKAHAKHLAENMTWGKAASLGAVAVGTAMMGSAIAGSISSGGTALPLTAPLFKAGMSIASAGLGTAVVQSFYQEATEIVEERHPASIREDLNQKGQEIQAEVEAGYREAEERRAAQQ